MISFTWSSPSHTTLPTLSKAHRQHYHQNNQYHTSYIIITIILNPLYIINHSKLYSTITQSYISSLRATITIIISMIIALSLYTPFAVVFGGLGGGPYLRIQNPSSVAVQEFKTHHRWRTIPASIIHDLINSASEPYRLWYSRWI